MAATSKRGDSIILVSGLLAAVIAIYFFFLSGADDSVGENMEVDNPEAYKMLLARIKPAVTLADITGENAKEEVQVEVVSSTVGSESAPVAEAEIKVMEEVVDEVVKAVSVGASSPDLTAAEAAYKTACFACHDFAVAGAPKLGDKAAWSSRIATGYDALLQTALNGKGAMPAKGGATHLSDAEVGDIVTFMMDKVK